MLSGLIEEKKKFLLAPMQAVTNLPFWHCLVPRGGPDIYVTEYFRVHVHSQLEPHILESIVENPTGRPVIAQMIGNDVEFLAKTALELQEYEIAGIDMNLGCPAPTVCGKSCGGALLKDRQRIRDIVERLRPIVSGQLTLKTRVGFESADEFDDLLSLFAELPIDALAIHGRTVREKYQSLVHTDKIAEAVETLPYPVYANGSVVSVDSGLGMLQRTSAAGLMIGRGAIRNPWLFSQMQQALTGEAVFRPTKLDLLAYVEELFDEVGKAIPRNYVESGHVQRIKRFLNYIAIGVDADGTFLYDIRRIKTAAEFHEVCNRHLQSNDLVPPDPEADGKLFFGFRELEV